MDILSNINYKKMAKNKKCKAPQYKPARVSQLFHEKIRSVSTPTGHEVGSLKT